MSHFVSLYNKSIIFFLKISKHRALSGARMADDAERPACLDRKAHIVDDLVVLDIGERHVIKTHVTLKHVAAHGIFRLADLRLGIHDFKKSLQGVGAVRRHFRHFAEKKQRRVNHVHISREHHEVGIIQSALYHKPAADAERDEIAERIENESG